MDDEQIEMITSLVNSRIIDLAFIKKEIHVQEFGYWADDEIVRLAKCWAEIQEIIKKNNTVK